MIEQEDDKGTLPFYLRSGFFYWCQVLVFVFVSDLANLINTSPALSLVGLG